MKQTVTIIGGGASALMLGCQLDTRRYSVSIYERNAAPGRKFLVAGDGGLNLTHSEAPEAFIGRYTPADFLKEHFQRFNNQQFIQWLHAQGIDTFTGSSGRVFPKKGLKPVEVLNILLQRVKENKVELHTRHVWKGFAPNGGLLFQSPAGDIEIKSDLVIFCLGGASWPVTGSLGDWVPHFENRGIRINPFLASNSSLLIHWPKELLPVIEGKALKNCAFSCGTQRHLGEAVLTAAGIEGSGIYPLSLQIREQLQRWGQAELVIDLKPGLDEAVLLKKLEAPRGKKSYTQHVSGSLNLGQVAMALLKHALPKEQFLDPRGLAAGVKKLSLAVTGTGPIDDAISTVGGIALEELSPQLELHKLPGHFALGEMLDYDAPTGGYLLQSAFSMGYSLSKLLNDKEL